MKKLSFYRSQEFKNIRWSFAASIAYPLAMFLATPIFLHRLGSTEFGVWVIINTFLQLMTTFNFGLGEANIKFISEYKSVNDNKGINKTISSTLAFSIIISCIIGVLTFLGTFIFEKFNYAGVPPDSMSAFRIVCLIFILRFIEITFLSIFQGFGRYDISSIVSVVSRICSVLANVLLLFMGYGLTAILLSSLAIQLLFLLFELIYIKLIFPFIALIPVIDIPHIKKIMSYGIWSWIQTFFSVVTTQSDKLIVAYVSGLEVLSYYSIGSMLMMQFHSIFMSLTSWVFPLVSEKVARKESLLKFYSNSQALLLLFGFASLSLFLLLDRFIITLWMGEKTYSEVINYVRLFIYYDLFLILSIIPYFFLNGSGFVKLNTFSEMILKVFNIIGMIVGYYILGNVGLIWGLIVSTALIIPLKIIQVKVYTLKLSWKWLGIESIACSVCLVAFFEIDIIFAKGILLLGALGVFYLTFLRSSSIPSMMRTSFSDFKRTFTS